MKLSVLRKFTPFHGCGWIAAALMTHLTVLAAEDSPATASPSKTDQGAGASAADQIQPKTGEPHDASAFLREAIRGNSAEVALAEVAERQAQNSEVKQFAQLMHKDHSQANRQLQPIAQAHSVSFNQPLDSKHQKKLEQFQKTSGAQFDREYITDMLKDHEKDIRKYEQAAQNIKETDVQQYAQTTLPTLRRHLQHAEQAAKAIGIDQATISSIVRKSHEAVGGTGEDAEKESGRGSKQE